MCGDRERKCEWGLHLFPFGSIDATAEFVSIAINFTETGRVFWQCWRRYWSCGDCRFLVLFIHTVNAGRGCRCAARETADVCTGRRQHWFCRQNWRWSASRCARFLRCLLGHTAGSLLTLNYWCTHFHITIRTKCVRKLLLSLSAADNFLLPLSSICACSLYRLSMSFYCLSSVTRNCCVCSMAFVGIMTVTKIVDEHLKNHSTELNISVSLTSMKKEHRFALRSTIV